MTLKLHALAENDLRIALNYYREISPKLEKRFLSHIDKQFNSILNTPNLYQYEDIIMILAIFHTKQNPNILTKR